MLCWRAVQAFNWIDAQPTSEFAPADALPDLATHENAFSLYLVAKADAPTRGERIAAAVHCKRKKGIDHARYVMFDASALTKVGAKVEEMPGETADSEVNTWHVNVVQADRLSKSQDRGLDLAEQVV